MENILECKSLSKIYKNAVALSAVNLLKSAKPNTAAYMGKRFLKSEYNSYLYSFFNI